VGQPIKICLLCTQQHIGLQQMYIDFFFLNKLLPWIGNLQRYKNLQTVLNG